MHRDGAKYSDEKLQQQAKKENCAQDILFKYKLVLRKRKCHSFARHVCTQIVTSFLCKEKKYIWDVFSYILVKLHYTYKKTAESKPF